MSSPPSAPSVAAPELGPWADSLELALLYSPEEGRVLEVNRAFARKFGRVATSLVDQAIADLVHHDDLPAWRAAAARLLRPPHHLSRENRWLTAQGWRWIAWEETARRDETGRVVAVRAIGRDVTKHRLAEEHFRKIAQAVEQAPVSIAITTPGGTPQYVNSRYTETTGYTLEEIFEKQIPLLREGHPSEAAYRRFCAVIASGHKWTGELRSRRKDGTDIWELVQVSPIRDHLDQITSLFCLREDITERKTLEEQLRHAQKMESLGALAGGIAHDFNNIISIVRGFTELAMALSPGDTQLPRYLNAVHAAALRASALVSQIRAFSLRAPAAHRAVDLAALVRDLVGLLGETFPRGIEIELRLDDTLDTFAADPDQLRQILLNLCVNARDAMPDGGRLLIATDRLAGGALSALGLDPALDYARLRVTDSGKGMPPEIRARIFEPFFSTKQNEGGTGLGLATVYNSVRNHEGAIDLQTELGVGTTFDVYLPLRARAEAELGPLTRSGGHALPPGSGHLLLAEDELPIQDLLGVVLHNAGYNVHPALDGAEAIEHILRPDTVIDLVLLDLNMPRQGGLEVLRVLRQHRPDVPVLVMSGNLNTSVLAELKSLDQHHVLEKPFELVCLGQALAALRPAPAPSPTATA